MTGRIKTTTAFRALQARRNDAKTFHIVSITKKGLPSKMPVGEECKARTIERAREILKRVEGLNPGRKFAIVDATTGEILS